MTSYLILPALAFGLALWGVARMAYPRWQAVTFWLAVGLAGQAATLQFIDAGTRLHYQHYQSPGSLLADGPLLALAMFALQVIVVTVGAWRRRRQLIAVAGRLRPAWRLLALAIFFVLTSATVSEDVAFYAGELALAGAVQAVHLLTVVLLALSVPVSGQHGADCLWLRATGIKGGKAALARSAARPAGSAGPPEAARPGVDRVVIGAALLVTLLCATLTVTVYGNHPHVADEVVYIYHARYFAAGQMSLPIPAAPDAFDVDLMHTRGDRWFSPVPVGWPAILAVGAFFGVPWLVNPLLAGLNLLLAGSLIRTVHSRALARLVVLLLAISPWYIFMGMSFMTHMSTLTGALIAAVGVARARAGGNSAWALIGGFGLGWTSLIRPLEAAATAIVLGLWSMGSGGKGSRWPRSLALVAGSMLVGALVLPYNQYLTGDPTNYPIMDYVDVHYAPGANAIGFGANRGLGWPLDPWPGHGPADAVVNANLNTYSVNTELFGWSTGSLLPLAVLLLYGVRRGFDLMMWLAIGVVCGLHTFYWFSGGPDFGARYWFLIIVPCAALTARALLGGAGAGKDEDASRRMLAPGVEIRLRTRALVAAGALCLMTLLTYLPWRAVDKYHHYLGMRPDIRRLAATHRFGKSLVLIRGDRHPDYASAAIYNPVDFTAAAPLFAWDKNAEARRQALLAYPHRPVWIVDGPSRTGSGFLVVDGPLEGATLLEDPS